ncbi:hypothetical protein ACFLS8_01010 [Chloroflexota bacterium]
MWAQASFGRGNAVGEAGRKMGVTEQTYYRWRRITGGVGPLSRSATPFLRTVLGFKPYQYLYFRAI